MLGKKNTKAHIVPDTSFLVDLEGTEEANVRRLLEHGIALPPQPRVLLTLQEKLASGMTNIRTLADIIAQDPAITATLFTVVRGAAFRKFHPFDSLIRILQVIGVQQTTNLIRAIALSATVPSPVNRAAFENFWMRSQEIAELSMLIADERMQVCNIPPDQAYLVGVFHDCGIPVMMQRFPDYVLGMLAKIEEHGDTYAHEEDKRFNTDHCVIGYLVAKHWNLPNCICDTIRFHHETQRIETGASRTTAAILRLAVHIYHQDQLQEDVDWAKAKGDVLEELALSESTLPELIDIIFERYNKTS